MDFCRLKFLTPLFWPSLQDKDKTITKDIEAQVLQATCAKAIHFTYDFESAKGLSLYLVYNAGR